SSIGHDSWVQVWREGRVGGIRWEGRVREDDPRHGRGYLRIFAQEGCYNKRVVKGASIERKTVPCTLSEQYRLRSVWVTQPRRKGARGSLTLGMRDLGGGERIEMNFLKVEWTRKRGIIALIATCAVVSSFVLGGYVATGNWNPWGNRHYYQVLNANFQECYTPVGGTPQCQSAHNVLFNTGAQYVEKLVMSNNEGFCAVSASCSFHFIAMSSNTVAPTATQSSTGANGATSS